MKDINELFNDTDLYIKETFKIFSSDKDNAFCKINDSELKRMLDCLGFGINKIITKCKKCNMEFPFDFIARDVNFYTMNNNKKSYNLSDGISIKLFENKYLHLDSIDRVVNYDGEKNIPIACLEDKTWYLTYYLTCTNCFRPYYMNLVLEQKGFNFILRKIGQYPSMFDVHGFDFSKYEKQLERINAYDDYKKADLSYAEEYYVGSFAYLRRIFEKLVNKYLSETEEKPSDNRMDSKIKVIKNRFDPLIQNSLKNVYGVLSASIHELDEEQSKEYYDILKAIIDIQLEYELTEEDKKKNATKYSSELAKISSKIKIESE